MLKTRDNKDRENEETWSDSFPFTVGARSKGSVGTVHQLSCDTNISSPNAPSMSILRQPRRLRTLSSI